MMALHDLKISEHEWTNHAADECDECEYIVMVMDGCMYEYMD